MQELLDERGGNTSSGRQNHTILGWVLRERAFFLQERKSGLWEKLGKKEGINLLERFTGACGMCRGHLGEIVA